MTNKILTLLIITLIFILPIAEVQGVTRYTRIANDDSFYIITGESTNSSNTHYNFYRLELDANTYDVISKEKFNKPDISLSAVRTRTSTPYYYSNRVVMNDGIYDINSLTELSGSVATFEEIAHDLEHIYLTTQNPKLSNYYDTLKHTYIAQSIFDPSSLNNQHITIHNNYYDNILNNGIDASNSFRIRFYPLSNGGLIHRTSTTTASYYYPSGTLAFISSADISQGFRLYAPELAPSGGNDAIYYYTNPNSAGSNVFVQKAQQNNTDAIRTITSSMSYIKSLTPVSSRSNYVYAVGYTTITGTPDYNVATMEVWDRLGNQISGFNSGTESTEYTFIAELETGDLAVIEHNTNLSKYKLLIYNPITLTIKQTINYDTTRILSVASKINNRKGIDTLQYNQMNSGVYSRPNGGFDAVPKIAYTYLNNGTQPSGVEITNVDLTNRILEMNLELDNNIDYYPLTFLVDDGDIMTTSNEKYGYYTLTDMALINSIDTGLISSGDEYNFTTFLSNDRFYIIDMNTTLLNTSASDYVTALFTINAKPLMGLVNRFSTPANSILTEYFGLYTPYPVAPFVDELLIETPHLIAYPQITGSSHDYTNLKILVDKYNNRYSINKKTYFEDGSSMQSGYTTWASLPTGTDSIENIGIALSSNATIDTTIDVYRTTNLPPLTTRSADTTYTTSKSMLVPILSSGTNKVMVAYSDSSTTEHANFEEWTITINTIGGDILGIGPSGEITETPGTTTITDGTPIFGGLLPDFMSTTQNSVMFYSFMIILIAMIIVFLIGQGSGYPLIGGIGAGAFGIMLFIYFALIGWLPAWLPVIGFVIAGLIGAGMVRNAFVGGN